MDKERAKEVLSQQMELLAAHSRQCDNAPHLCALTSAMVEIFQLVYDLPGFLS